VAAPDATALPPQTPMPAEGRPLALHAADRRALAHGMVVTDNAVATAVGVTSSPPEATRGRCGRDRLRARRRVPHGRNIGGGGFAVTRAWRGRALDFRETAPRTRSATCT